MASRLGFVAVALSLLGEVRWRGQTVAGDRPQALLAALASGEGRPVADERLVELVWGDEPPANAAKSLHVLVSRTRAACGTDAIVRAAPGYRLGIDPAEVDSARVASLLDEARAALDRDATSARELASEALALGGLLGREDGGEGALAEIRHAAAGKLAMARAVVAQASSRMGAHPAALPDAHRMTASQSMGSAVLPATVLPRPQVPTRKPHQGFFGKVKGFFSAIFH